MAKKLTKEIIKQRLVGRDIELASPNYMGNSTKHLWRCLINPEHEWEAVPKDVAGKKQSGCPHCRKLSIALIKKRLKEQQRNITLLSTTYIGAQEKLKWKCSVANCNHEWEAFPSDVTGKKQHGCPKCAGILKPTIEHIKQKIVDRPLILLSTEYVNNVSHLKWKCLNPKCNKEWNASYNSVVNTKHGCPHCYLDKRRLSLDAVRDLVYSVNPHIKLISTVYKNAGTPLTWKCTVEGCEKIWKAPYSRLVSGSKCPRCVKAETFTAELIKEKIATKPIELLSSSYKRGIKSKWLCKIDGTIWETHASNIISGSGCPTCGALSTNITLAERYKKQYLKTPHNVYILKCFNTDEYFYKIGVCKSSISYRYKGKISMPYEYEVIYFKEMNKYTSTYWETEALQKHYKQNLQYTPKIPFSGSLTECFTGILPEYMDLNKDYTK